jgi:hypothetical protein
MNKFLAFVAVMAIAVWLSVLTMKHGFGLEVQSWWWLICGILGQMVLRALAVNVLESKK